MILSFHPCLVPDAQIILGDRALGPEDLSLIARADAIILPQGCPHALYKACRNAHASLFPNYDARYQYPGKIGQSRFSKKMNWTHPETRIWSSVEEWKDSCSRTGALPHRTAFLLKADQSHEGEGIFVIKDGAALEAALEALRLAERSGSNGFISQDLIPSDGNVLRSVVIGKRVVTYWKRAAGPDEIITTISKGAWLDEQWRPDLQEKGKSAACRFSQESGINLAAMDFVFFLAEPDPQPLILEINYYFGRRGLGGSLRYYRLLYEALQEWLADRGFDPSGLDLV
jgi:ribosomal protein S6--L-glutamate ligase